MDQKYKGMTVNERLYISGQVEEFDLAVKEKDTAKTIEILKKVEIADFDALHQILKELGLD